LPFLPLFWLANRPLLGIASFWLAFTELELNHSYFRIATYIHYSTLCFCCKASASNSIDKGEIFLSQPHPCRRGEVLNGNKTLFMSEGEARTTPSNPIIPHLFFGMTVRPLTKLKIKSAV